MSHFSIIIILPLTTLNFTPNTFTLSNLNYNYKINPLNISIFLTLNSRFTQLIQNLPHGFKNLPHGLKKMYPMDCKI